MRRNSVIEATALTVDNGALRGTFRATEQIVLRSNANHSITSS
jgi:hypothetical protein